MARNLRRHRWASLVVGLLLVPVGFASVAGVSDAVASDAFVDVPSGSVHIDGITWLAEQGITLGCNPPANDRFCPEQPVTRAQMASFLTRALFLTEAGAGDRFVDDDGSVHEGDIERLAEAGITLGCNPPANDRFCPDQPVTRAQMASFLQRAFLNHLFGPVATQVATLPGVVVSKVLNMPGRVESVRVVSGDHSLMVAGAANGSSVGLSIETPMNLAPGTHEVSVVADVCRGLLACDATSTLPVSIELRVHVSALGETILDGFAVPLQERLSTSPEGYITVPGERIALASEGKDTSEVVAAASTAGAHVIAGSDALGMYQLRFADEASAISGSSDLVTLAVFDFVEPYAGSPGGPAVVPSDWDDDGPDGTWTFDMTDMTNVWDRTTGSRNVRMGIIDIGIFPYHEDLNDNFTKYMAYEASWIDSWRGSGTGKKTDSHGTRVAGVMCADQNGTGLVGVMWECDLRGRDIFGLTDSLGWDAQVIAPRVDDFMSDTGPYHVVNMSFSAGGAHENAPLGCEERPTYAQTAAFRNLFEKYDQTLFVVSSGNCGLDAHVRGATPMNLDSLPNVLAVAAQDSDGQLWHKSDKYAGVAAPGGFYGTASQIEAETHSVWSTAHRRCGESTCESWYDQAPGTSVAAPFVAGIAGLVFSIRPDLTAAQVEDCIEQGSTVDTGEPGLKGVNPMAILDCAEGMPNDNPVPEPPPEPEPTITLERGAQAPRGSYYSVTLTDFPASRPVTLTCHDSTHAAFDSVALITDSFGAATDTALCYSDQGPDHWVTAGEIESNHVRWDATPPTPRHPAISLARGDPADAGYWYSVGLSGFPDNTDVLVTCHDSINSGFWSASLKTNDAGQASSGRFCYSGFGPDHWVTGGGVESNHVTWTVDPPPDVIPQLAYTVLEQGVSPAFPDDYWQAGVAIANADGSGTEQVASSGGGSAVSPDGTKIAYGVGCVPQAVDDCIDSIPIIHVVNLDDWSVIDFGAVRSAAGLTMGAFGWSWNPDSNGLTFGDGSTNGTDRGIWTLNLDGSGAREIHNNPERHEAAPRVSPDGTLVGYSSSSSDGGFNVHVFADFQTGNELWGFKRDIWLSYEWLPDSRLVFAHRNPSSGHHSLVIADPATKSTTTLVEFGSPLLISDLSPSFDASFISTGNPANAGSIAYAALGALRLWDLASGDSAILMPASEMVTSAAWLADGRRIAYASDKSGVSRVYVLDTETGAKTEVGAGPGKEPAAIPLPTD